MPHVDHDAERRRLNRALALSRRKGDFLTLDATPAVSVMVIDGRPTRMTPPISEAELEAANHREWEKEFEKKYLSYW
jgi:hypothetical protein